MDDIRMEPGRTPLGRVPWLAISVAGLAMLIAAASMLLIRPWTASSGTGRLAGATVTLLVLAHGSGESDQVAFGGGLGQASNVMFGVNSRGCVTFGRSVVIAQPGSRLSADDKSLTLQFVDGDTHTFRLGEPVFIGIGGGTASLRYPSSVPQLVGQRSAAACGSNRLIVVQEADQSPG
jgi:hypothetical protein